MKKFTISTAAVVLFSLFSVCLQAQDHRFGESPFKSSARSNGNDKDKDGHPDNNNGQGNNQNVPIDGGLTVLLAAGALYGAKKIMRKQKHADNKTN